MLSRILRVSALPLYTSKRCFHPSHNLNIYKTIIGTKSKYDTPEITSTNTGGPKLKLREHIQLLQEQNEIPVQNHDDSHAINIEPAIAAVDETVPITVDVYSNDIPSITAVEEEEEANVYSTTSPEHVHPVTVEETAEEILPPGPKTMKFTTKVCEKLPGMFDITPEETTSSNPKQESLKQKLEEHIQQGAFTLDPPPLVETTPERNETLMESPTFIRTDPAELSRPVNVEKPVRPPSDHSRTAREEKIIDDIHEILTPTIEELGLMSDMEQPMKSPSQTLWEIETELLNIKDGQTVSPTKKSASPKVTVEDRQQARKDMEDQIETLEKTLQAEKTPESLKSDVKSEETKPSTKQTLKRSEAEVLEVLQSVRGIGTQTAKKLFEHGIESLDDLVKLDVNNMQPKIRGMERLIENAKELLKEPTTGS